MVQTIYDITSAQRDEITVEARYMEGLPAGSTAVKQAGGEFIIQLSSE